MDDDSKPVINDSEVKNHDSDQVAGALPPWEKALYKGGKKSGDRMPRRNCPHSTRLAYAHPTKLRSPVAREIGAFASTLSLDTRDSRRYHPSDFG